jgi:hypothetical protein
MRAPPSSVCVAVYRLERVTLWVVEHATRRAQITAVKIFIAHKIAEI